MLCVLASETPEDECEDAEETVEVAIDELEGVDTEGTVIEDDDLIGAITDCSVDVQEEGS